MALKYTTQNAISLRLAKRLQVGGTPTTYGKEVLDTALLELIGPQVEAKFEMAIAHLYILPLAVSNLNSQQIVASCVEKMILSEVLPTQFFPEVGREGGLRKVMADESKVELEAIASGRLKLDGERIATSAAQGFPSSSAVRVVKRGASKPGAAESIQW